MNAKQKLHQIHLQEWTVRFADQKASGLTVRQKYSGVRPHKEKINISKKNINKTRGAEAPYAARMNHTPLRGEQQATVL